MRTLSATHADCLRDLPQGWFHHAEQILDLLDQARPQVCVELGTWRGASAIAMARLIRTWGGSLTCVDTWTGNVNYGYAGTVPGPPAMLMECAWNLIAADVAPHVRLIPALTVAAGVAWQGPIDFLYVDADHSYESALADLETWARHLRVGGLIAGDDYENPLYPGVQRAWDEFEARYGQRFTRTPTPDTNPPGMRLIYGRMIQHAGLLLHAPRAAGWS